MLAGAVLASSAVVAQAQSFYYTGGNVTVKYLGASAGDISTLYYKVGGAYNVGSYTALFNNTPVTGTTVGTQVILTVPLATLVGAEVFFRLDNSGVSTNCPCSWYSGIAGRNADGKVHVATLAGSGLAAAGGGNYTTAFNYEDRYIPPADGDYNDLNFEIAGVTTVPEPSSMVLMATGILALGVAARRRRRV